MEVGNLADSDGKERLLSNWISKKQDTEMYTALNSLSNNVATGSCVGNSDSLDSETKMLTS
jgi:hypothetical protein